MKALSDVQQLILTVMKFCLSEYVVCVEMGAKENIFLFTPHPFFEGMGRGCAFFFAEGVLFSFAADLNLGEFTGMTFERDLSQPSQLRLRISQSWFYSWSDFLPVIFWQETHADAVVCLHRAANNIRTCIFSFCLPIIGNKSSKLKMECIACCIWGKVWPM